MPACIPVVYYLLTSEPSPDEIVDFSFFFFFFLFVCFILEAADLTMLSSTGGGLWGIKKSVTHRVVPTASSEESNYRCSLFYRREGLITLAQVPAE